MGDNMPNKKIAVCVSGLCNNNALKNMEKLQKQFPYDFYFGIWKGRENNVSKQLGAVSFEEPTLSYHPYCDMDDDVSPKFLKIQNKFKKEKIPSNFNQKTMHQTKQILAHAYLLNYISKEYDIVIRTRFDVVISNNINFNEYIDQSYIENCAIGFGTPYAFHPTIHTIREINADDKLSRHWFKYLMDLFIIHPTSLFNTNLVFDLHQQKKLRAAEFGWYQILSQPFNNNPKKAFHFYDLTFIISYIIRTYTSKSVH